jgi:hypothetical protein
MAVVPEQGPLSFVPMTLAATTVNSTNPNVFAVSVQLAGGTTITSVSVNNAVVGTSGGVYTVPGSGTFKATYTGSPSLYTSVAPAATYPFTSAEMQNYTAQQNLSYGTGTGPGGSPIIQEDA